VTYIKEAISILKNRWPEAMLLVGLGLTLGFLNMNSITIEKDNASPQAAVIFLSLAIMAFFLLFKTGFLKTVQQSGDEPQQPLTLLKEGKKFLWRFVLLGMLYITIYFAATLIVMPFLVPQEAIASNPEKFIPVIEKLAIIDYIIVTLIFMKFIIFLPALIIVNDVPIAFGLSMLKYCKLKEAKGIVVLFLIQMAVNLTWLLLPDFEIELKYQKIMSLLPTIINQCFILVISVAAIRFVSSLNLLYDNENKSESDITEGEN